MADSDERLAKKRSLPPLYREPAFLPVPLFILLFAVLYAAGPDLRSWKYVFEPPWLLFTLNAVFITGLCLLVAWLSIRSYLRGGFLNVLLLGCGVLAFGLSSFTAGWLIRPPYGPNDTVTIHNTGVLFLSGCFFLSSLSAFRGVGMETDPVLRRPLAGSSYLAIFLLVALLTAATMLDWTPPFLIPGEGPTVLRQVVLAVSVTLLAVSSILMLSVYSDRMSGFLLYSLIAILLIGTGLVAVAFGTPGSPLSWLGRISQYLGDVFLVVAAVKALNEAKGRGTTVEEALADYFRRSEMHYRALVEMAADAIVACDSEGRILLMNPAAERIFSYQRQEAAGKRMAELIVPDHSRDLFQVLLTGKPCRDREMELSRNDGSIFPAELSVSPEMQTGGGAARTIIIRDISGRKQAEEALRESERRFRTLAEATFEGVAVTESGRLVDLNDQLCRILGYEHSELQGREVSEMIHPEDRQRVLANIREDRESIVTHQMIRKDGATILVEAHGKTIRRAGKGRRYTSIRDITERKRTEKALQQAKDYAEMLIQTANVLIVGLDENGNVLTFNDQAEQITGYSRAEILGRNWFEVVVPKDRYPHVAEAFGRLQQGSLPEEFENPILTKDGRERIISWRNSEIREDGTLRGTISFGRDITESRQAEESLRAYHELLKISQRAANAGIWSWEVASGRLTWSEEFYALFGLEPSAPASFATWLSVLHPEDREPAMERIQRSIRDRTPLENEYRIIHPDGQERWIRAAGNTDYNEDGQPQSMSGICIDATESKRAEEAIRRAKDELEEKVRERTAELMMLLEDLERSRADLRKLATALVRAEERERKRISVILHDEVAQTLAATKMRLDLLRNLSGGDEYRRAVSEAEELIGRSIRQTRALMSDIANPVLYDMGLRAAVEALAEDVKARQGISCTCSFSGRLADLGQELNVMIFQVIKELVQNIVKHSRARNASIRIAEEGKGVSVTVADDGRGFNAESIGPADTEGGFGLFSIRERVTSFGGKISIESGTGKGSRVTVELPKTAGRAGTSGRANRIIKT